VHRSIHAGSPQLRIRTLRLRPTAARYRDLWQTEWLFGTVFALRLSFECGKQARREYAGGDSNSCR
jgi:hypothetical protein